MFPGHSPRNVAAFQTVNNQNFAQTAGVAQNF
jgi:hypothetical protein